MILSLYDLARSRLPPIGFNKVPLITGCVALVVATFPMQVASQEAVAPQGGVTTIVETMTGRTTRGGSGGSGMRLMTDQEWLDAAARHDPAPGVDLYPTVPVVDVVPQCRDENFGSEVGPNFDACFDKEQAAYDELKRAWPGLTPAQKSTCERRIKYHRYFMDEDSYVRALDCVRPPAPPPPPPPKTQRQFRY